MPSDLETYLREEMGGPYEFNHFQQPIVNVQTSHIVGYEITTALSSNSGVGLMRPNALMKRMPSPGMINEFDRAMVNNIANRIVNRPSVGQYRWFVNISSDAVFLSLNERVFRQPHRVALECSLPGIADPEQQSAIQAHAAKLTALGIKLALVPDTRGRYNAPLLSSGMVSYMKTTYPLLQALISDHHEAAKSNAIYWVNEARKRNIPVIGFGLEAFRHLKSLVMLDVEYAQGYSLQRPIPVRG